MAGAVIAISSNSQLENPNRNSQISAVIDCWQVEYARFVNCSSSMFKRTHPSLSPKAKHRGTWISSASAAVKLIYERSSAGLDDVVLILSLRSRVLEEHYISKLHFSWPQVSCMSEFPARGSRAVFLSYKDGVGQTQKFALRFATIYETEKFMNIVKEILENGNPQLLQCPEFHSEMSSQAEAISPHGPTFMPIGECQHKNSVDYSPQLMLPSSEFNAAQDSVSHQEIGDREATEAMSVFPPSFTELMKNCHPAVPEVKPTESGEDLKTQFVRYLEGTSFKELLATVENVISQLGDDVML